MKWDEDFLNELEAMLGKAMMQYDSAKLCRPNSPYLLAGVKAEIKTLKKVRNLFLDYKTNLKSSNSLP